jgi:hypothetical protein
LVEVVGPVFAPKCPVNDRERAWVNKSVEWFRGQFGDSPLAAPTILPTREFFPPPAPARDADVRALVRRVADYMAVRPAVTVEFASEIERVEWIRRLQRKTPGAPVAEAGHAGEYCRTGRHGRHVVMIDRASFGRPAQLIAVIAHELGHVRLLGERHSKRNRTDQEALTDLVTVYLGMGIFTANAAIGRNGYLTEQGFGYGLAVWARLRGEPDPPWQEYLDRGPRAHLKQSLRYLRSQS